jgi:hypothetical protein
LAREKLEKGSKHLSGDRPSVDQCKRFAENFKVLGADPKNSARRTSVLNSIARTCTALAHQLENLAMIEKSERKVSLTGSGPQKAEQIPGE